ncbi:MAG: penicillin-binding protein 2 [Balneolaceae bacterium]
MHSLHKQKQNVRTSIRILQAVVFAGFLIMLVRVFQLQIVDYETYSPLSRQNSIRMEVINPARGLILDRNGTILVENQPIYSITITPVNFKMENIEKLASLLKMDESRVLEKIQEAQDYSWQRTSRLFTEVSFDVFSNIQENIWQLPGIGHQIESKRNYPSEAYAPHVMGYLREATREEYLAADEMRLGDKIGRSGLEMVYEDFLKGKFGTEYVKVNAYGQTLGTYGNGELNISPTKGADLVTTLDARLQALGEKLMEGKQGGIVAMNPQNGEILSLVSAPQYDITRLAGKMDTEYWQTVNVDAHTPLYNRAISSRQPPGSTFKPFMGLVGLHLGIITPDTEIHNSGAYMRGRAYHDLAEPGDYDLELALTRSSNTYFFWLMDRIGSQQHLNEWADLVNDFGIGPRNQIDLPSEVAGIIPDSTYLNQAFGVRNWGIGDLISLGVGQGLISVSPLQMAVAVSSIANNGYKVQPHLVSRIQYSNGDVNYTGPEKEKIDWIRPDHLQTVQDGMRGVVTVGSGRYYANIPGIEVAGKTGTAQNPHGEDHGWFIAYAPVSDPQIAIAVLTENSGYGSISAAPIASLMIEQYLKGEIQRQHVLNYVLDFKPVLDEETEVLQ